MKRYYTIDIDAMKHFNLNTMEWMILENIHFLCAETGWCYATKKSLCKHHDISTQMYRRYVVSLIDKKFIKENSKGHLKTTKNYLDILKQKFQSDRNKSFNESETKVSTSSIKRDIKRDKEEELEIPSQINATLWDEFVTHRKQLKKPMTRLAKEKTIKILLDNIDQHEEMIETAIASGWQTVYPKKERFKTSTKSENQKHIDAFFGEPKKEQGVFDVELAE